MKPETKTCQNCKQKFVIESEDFNFYEKIQVPPPTFCPECRMVRRMCWRNERYLYKNKCGLCERSIITIYSPDKPHKIYCSDCFHGDKWDPMAFGVDIDFSRPFLEQFKELQLKVPRLYAFVFQNFNSEYTNGSAFNKNCYLIFVSDHNEDCSYCYSTFHSKNSLDCLNSNECELCYNCISCNKCYKVLFSEDCSDSQDLIFCKDCVNCHDCMGSVNLRNQQYYIFNIKYSKEEYLNKIKEFKLNTIGGLNILRKNSTNLWLKYPTKYIHGLRNTNVIGDYVISSKNSEFIFDSELIEDSKFLNIGNKAKSCYDGYVAVDGPELSYEIVSAIATSNVKSGYCVWHDFNVTYSDTCENSNNLFGCVGLRKKQYCILNKQYSKEQYEELLPKIIQHMKNIPYHDLEKRIYSYGEYFPPDLSPFAYNETVAQEYFPLTKEQALEQGYKWKDREPRNYSIDIKTEDLPDNIKDVDESIINKVIECAHHAQNEHPANCEASCTEAFKIISDELQFYRRMNLPLPRLCPNCRHYERLKQRNPLKLWHRTCMCNKENHHNHNAGKCEIEFETSYAPDRPEIVYCEKCYQQEVY